MCICVKNKESVAQVPYKSSQFQISIHGLRREELDLNVRVDGSKIVGAGEWHGLNFNFRVSSVATKVMLGHFCMVEENQFEVVVVRRVLKYFTVNN